MYSAWSVVAGEQPTAAKWNLLGSNDASFNDGSGLAFSAGMANNSPIYEKNAGGTPKMLQSLATDDRLRFGQIPTQDRASNLTTLDNELIQTGWGFISTGGGGVSQVTSTVTFEKPFTTIYGIIGTTIGLLSGSDPATIPALSATTGGDIIFSAYQPALTTFIASLKVAGGTSFAANQRWGFSWIAFGVKA